MGAQVQLVWFWEGPVHRYYIPSAEWRSSRELSLWYLRRGSVKLLWEAGSRVVPAGHWIMPPPVRRNEVFSPDAEIVSLRMEVTLGNGSMAFRPRQPVVFPYLKSKKLERAATDLRLYLVRQLQMDTGMKHEFKPLTLGQDLQVNVLTTSVFIAFLDRAAASGQAVDGTTESIHPTLQKVLIYLDHRDLDQPLKIKSVTDAVGISPSHLRRLFRDEMGISLKAWDARRITRSVRNALGEGGLTIKEIAFAHGFHSPSHFCRWFRSTHHCSPGQWIKENPHKLPPIPR